MANKIASWKPGYRHVIDASTAYDEIERLKKKFKENFTTKLLAKEAKKKNNPLHNEIYDRGEKEAAEAYYISRAGHVLRAIQIEIVESSVSEPVRAFHPIVVENEECNNDDKVWVSVEDAMKDDGMRNQLLERAKSELNAVRKKYNELHELASIWDAIDSCA